MHAILNFRGCRQAGIELHGGRDEIFRTCGVDSVIDEPRPTAQPPTSGFKQQHHRSVPSISAPGLAVSRLLNSMMRSRTDDMGQMTHGRERGASCATAFFWLCTRSFPRYVNTHSKTAMALLRRSLAPLRRSLLGAAPILRQPGQRLSRLAALGLAVASLRAWNPSGPAPFATRAGAAAARSRPFASPATSSTAHRRAPGTSSFARSRVPRRRGQHPPDLRPFAAVWACDMWVGWL